MKKALALLALLSLLGCAGKQYLPTEGPFRGKFLRAFSLVRVGETWQLPIYFQGVLPDGPVHVEGYQDNNGSSYFEYHADIPEMRSRYFRVARSFDERDYCESVGRPLDRFDPSTTFFNRGRNQGDPMSSQMPIPPDAADGSVGIRFVFKQFVQDSQGEWKPGKILSVVKTVVKLSCTKCRCGGQLN